MVMKWTQEEVALLLNIRKQHPTSSWKFIATKYNAKVDSGRRRTHWSLTWKYRSLTSGDEIRPRGHVSKIGSASAPSEMRKDGLALEQYPTSDLTSNSSSKYYNDITINRKGTDHYRILKSKRPLEKSTPAQPARHKMETPEVHLHYAVPPPSHFHSSQNQSDSPCRHQDLDATSTFFACDTPAKPRQFTENSIQQMHHTDRPKHPSTLTAWQTQPTIDKTTSNFQTTYFEGSQNNSKSLGEHTYTVNEENVEDYHNPHEEATPQKSTTRHDSDLSWDSPLTSIDPHPFYKLPQLTPGAFGYGDYASRTYYNPPLALHKGGKNAFMGYHEDQQPSKRLTDY